MEAVLNELVSVDDLLVRPCLEGGERGRLGRVDCEESRGRGPTLPSISPGRATELRLPAVPAAPGYCARRPSAAQADGSCSFLRHRVTVFPRQEAGLEI